MFVEQQKYPPQLRGGQETSHVSIHRIFMDSLPCVHLRTVDQAVGAIDIVFCLTEPTFLMVR